MTPISNGGFGRTPKRLLPQENDGVYKQWFVRALEDIDPGQIMVVDRSAGTATRTRFRAPTHNHRHLLCKAIARIRSGEIGAVEEAEHADGT